MTPTNPNEVNHHGTRTGSSDLCGAEVRVRESSGEAEPNLLAVGCTTGPAKAEFGDVPSGAPTRGEARQGGGYSTDAASGLDGAARWTQEQRDKAGFEVEKAYLAIPHIPGSWPAERVKEVAVELQMQRNELLEALKELLAWNGAGTAEQNGAKCDTLFEAEDKAAAAIAKAVDHV